MKPLVLFYILVVYIFIQFSWWAYLLVDLNKEVYIQKIAYIQEHGNSGENIRANLSKLHQKWIMIAGEGAVFLSLLALGAFQTRKAFKQEVQLAKRQKNFLLSVTHELKSPLASIKLYLQTLLKHDLEKNRQQSLLNNAILDTERLNNLLENVLTAAKLDSNQEIFYKERVNLSLLLHDTLQQLLLNNDRKNDIDIYIEENVHCIFDKQAFSSVIANLVENALKYSEKGSHIIVSLKQSESRILLSVSDLGIGIEDKEKWNIFDKFYRIGNEDTRKTKGTGLGLYIVKNIVENHKGKITVKNNHPKGSIFEIVLNCA